jgi:Flp pilus assembly protein TadG
MINIRKFFCQFLRDERATATIEFVIVFPIVIILFIAVFETSMILTRQVLLEKSLDSAVRILRLTSDLTTTDAEVRTNICANTMILHDCEALLVVDLRMINTVNYDLPDSESLCVNRATSFTPATQFQQGGSNDLMLVRVCAVVDRILPFSGFGLNMTRDDSGGMHMMASSIFVVEPR